jgi:MbtH protein
MIRIQSYAGCELPGSRPTLGQAALTGAFDMSWGDENTTFRVVVNHEGQYSIWPDYKAIPAGWSAVGKDGRKEDCLAYIEEVWTDMRPLSLRKAMDGDAAGQGVAAQPAQH